MKINKIVIVVLLFVAASKMATSQELRFNGFTNYVFDDKVEGYDADNNYRSGTVNGGFQWGTGLEFLPTPTKGIEIKYIRQDTKFTGHNRSIDQDDLEKDLAINYILLGANNYFPVNNEKIEPYAGGSIGMAIMNLDNITENLNATKFAWELKLGTNIWINDKIGLKIQASMLSAVQSIGGSFYVGTGGSGAGVSTYSSMLQFSLGGGLTFKLR